MFVLALVSRLAARRALPDGSVSSGGGGTTLAGMTMAGSSELA